MGLTSTGLAKFDYTMTVSVHWRTYIFILFKLESKISFICTLFLSLSIFFNWSPLDTSLWLGKTLKIKAKLPPMKHTTAKWIIAMQKNRRKKIAFILSAFFLVHALIESSGLYWGQYLAVKPYDIKIYVNTTYNLFAAQFRFSTICHLYAFTWFIVSHLLFSASGYFSLRPHTFD